MIGVSRVVKALSTIPDGIWKGNTQRHPKWRTKERTIRVDSRCLNPGCQEGTAEDQSVGRRLGPKPQSDPGVMS